MITINGSTLFSGHNQFFILFFLALMMLVCFWLVFHYLKRARLIEDTPTSKIRSAAAGYVEIVGTVPQNENHVLNAPLSGTECVWFTYKIQRYQRTGKRSHWSTIEENTSTHHFTVKDSTGACVVDPQGAEVLSEHSRTWYGYTKKPDQSNSNINSFQKIFGGKRYRYIEKFIYIHDTIHALGLFESNGGGRNVPSNHQMTGQVIREWKQNFKKILARFDRDKNGEIDMDEWKTVRTAASQEAEKRRQALSNMPTVYTLRNTGQKYLPFILSTFSQKKLTKKYRYFAFYSLIGLVFFTAIIFTQLSNVSISNL